MDQTSRVLVQILRAAALPPSGRMQLLPTEALGALAFGVALDEAACQQLAAALRSVAQGTRDIGEALGEVGARLREIDAASARRLAARLDMLEPLIEQALTIAAAIESPVLRVAAIQINDPRLFHVINQLTLANAQAGADLVIIGTGTPTPTPRRINLSAHALSDRVQIAYDARSPFPYLTLTVASMSESLDWAAARPQFQLKDLSPEGLELLSRHDRHLGRVVLERQQLPYHLADSLALHIEPQPDTALVTTTIVGTGDEPLARLLRIVPPPLQ